MKKILPILAALLILSFLAVCKKGYKAEYDEKNDLLSSVMWNDKGKCIEFYKNHWTMVPPVRFLALMEKTFKGEAASMEKCPADDILMVVKFKQTETTKRKILVEYCHDKIVYYYKNQKNDPGKIKAEEKAYGKNEGYEVSFY